MTALKAIVVDDDPSALTLMQRILQRRNYEVITYDDPLKSPLYSCKTCPCPMHDFGCPDLIVSDFNMPVMNGVELLECNIKKGCRCRHLALMSGAVIPDEALRRAAKYGTRYFMKSSHLPDWDDFYDWLNRIEVEIRKNNGVRLAQNSVKPLQIQKPAV